MSDPIQTENLPAIRGPEKIREREAIALRRRYVAEWRFDGGLTYAQIRERLARLDPPVHASIASIHRDVEYHRETITRQYTKEFDVRKEFVRLMSSYQGMYDRAMRHSRASKDPAAKVAWARTAKEALDRMFDNYVDVGVFNKQLASLLFAQVADDVKVDRIPSGDEMQRYFAENQVQEGELVSEAERAYLYGDEGAATDE